jgi:ribosomal protein L40E
LLSCRNRYFPFGFNESEQIDGPLALPIPDGVALFASHAEGQMGGGIELRSLEIYDRAMQLHDIAQLHSEYELLSKWECTFCNTVNPWDQTTCRTCMEQRTDIDPAALIAEEEGDISFVDKVFQ